MVDRQKQSSDSLDSNGSLLSTPLRLKKNLLLSLLDATETRVEPGGCKAQQ